MAATSVERHKRKLPERLAQVRGPRSQRQFARDLGVFQQNVNRYRRCQDVCPVGADYEAMLKDALDEIPEDTADKAARLEAMAEAESRGELPESHDRQQRWIGDLGYLK